MCYQRVFCFHSSYQSLFVCLYVVLQTFTAAQGYSNFVLISLSVFVCEALKWLISPRRPLKDCCTLVKSSYSRTSFKDRKNSIIINRFRRESRLCLMWSHDILHPQRQKHFLEMIEFSFFMCHCCKFKVDVEKLISGIENAFPVSRKQDATIRQTLAFSFIWMAHSVETQRVIIRPGAAHSNIFQ